MRPGVHAHLWRVVRWCYIMACWLVQMAHAQLPINGPMPGATQANGTSIWLQCKEPCSAQLAYWPANGPGPESFTTTFSSTADSGHCLLFRLAGLSPGTTYAYRVITNGKEVATGPLFFRTQPAWPEDQPLTVRFATGSCAYLSEGGDGPAYTDVDECDTGIFDRIAENRPDFMLWLGDNVYLRAGDWDSWAGYLHRYTHARSHPALSQLMRSTHHYAIWDDHDHGPNDSGSEFAGADMARQAFRLFWPNPEPPPSLAQRTDPGLYGQFAWGDCDFFLLDDRSFRTSASAPEPALLGPAQLERLVTALRASSATFKFVALGSQFLNTARVFENYAQHAQERQQLLQRIETDNVSGVVFLTGDRHRSELSRATLDNGEAIYDLTVSPLTSKPRRGGMLEENKFLVPNSRVEQCNYALLEVRGPKQAREVLVELRGAKGQLLKTWLIPAQR
jgi:alkaline phosphatase D